jgi:hypothetical protein
MWRLRLPASSIQIESVYNAVNSQKWSFPQAKRIGNPSEYDICGKATKRDSGQAGMTKQQ